MNVWRVPTDQALFVIDGCGGISRRCAALKKGRYAGQRRPRNGMLPGSLISLEMSLIQFGGKDIVDPFNPIDALQDRDRGDAERTRILPCLRIGKAQTTVLEVDVVPTQCGHLVPPATGERPKPHDIQYLGIGTLSGKFIERLAGYRPDQIAPMFAGVPSNVRLPDAFAMILAAS